jgi:DNA recombination protein Rad52
MAFTDQQVRALRRRVPPRSIKTRVSNGKELSYVEGWYALDRANQIFGFDGWTRETLEVHCVSARAERGTFAAVYTARVRVGVWSGDRTIVRDGHGTGEASGASVGEAHDRALKGAETDATKRALATFGKAFGLALYAGPVQRRAAAGDGTANARPVDVPSLAQAALFAQAAVLASAPSRTRTTSNGAREGDRLEPAPLTFPKLERVRNKDHLRYVASQPCLLCSWTPSDAHHLRFAQPRALARKVGDEFTVPLCRSHHRELHQSGNEVAWWHDMGIDPLDVAKRLWADHVGQDAGN